MLTVTEYESDVKPNDVITVDAGDVTETTVTEVATQKKNSASDDSVDLTIVDDSVVEVESHQSKIAKGKNGTENAVEEKFEIKKLFFQDVKELDVFLLQATNSGESLFRR